MFNYIYIKNICLYVYMYKNILFIYIYIIWYLQWKRRFVSQLKILGCVSWAKRLLTKKNYIVLKVDCVCIKDIRLGKVVNMFIRY